MRARWLSLAVAVALAAALVACGRDDERRGGSVTRITGPEERDRAGAPIDEALLLALAQAKNFHHKAQVYISDGKLDEAIASVRAILSIPFPPGAAEGEDVRLDARALLAKLLLGRGQRAEAMTVVDEGLAGATRESFFVANLYTVKGEVLQAEATALDATGVPADHDRAVQLRREAITYLDRSIAIDLRLQRALSESLEER